MPEVASVKDMEVPGQEGPIRARFYNPQPDASSPLPALIFIHGGQQKFCKFSLTLGSVCTCYVPLCHAESVCFGYIDHYHKLWPRSHFLRMLTPCSAVLAYVVSVLHRHRDKDMQSILPSCIDPAY